MNLEKVTTESLLEELEKRKEKETKQDETVLVCGTIGIDVISHDNTPSFVEWFTKIENESDLEPLSSISLRARFNPQRHYQLFYFKCTHAQFDDLHSHLDKDNHSFAKWIRNTSSITFRKL